MTAGHKGREYGWGVFLNCILLAIFRYMSQHCPQVPNGENGKGGSGGLDGIVQGSGKTVSIQGHCYHSFVASWFQLI